MTEDTIAAVALVALACAWSYACAKFAAQTNPLTWGAIFAAALLQGLGFMLLSSAAPPGRPSFVAAALWLLALVIGAHRGRLMLEHKVRADTEHEARLLAYVATLGPCAVCGSGDLQRRQCDVCHSVFCSACSLRHRPYRNARQAPCPLAGNALSVQ
jgi:hypothetical protein